MARRKVPGALLDAPKPQSSEEPSDTESGQSRNYESEIPPSEDEEADAGPLSPSIVLFDRWYTWISGERAQNREIIKQLERILSQKFEPPGNYVSTTQYANAPNPCISLDDYGVIGLPLECDTATNIANLFRETPKVAKRGKKAKALSKLEIDAGKVRKFFLILTQTKFWQVTVNNVAWNQWVDETILPQMCNALGIDSSRAKVTAELDKMILCNEDLQ